MRVSLFCVEVGCPTSNSLWLWAPAPHPGAERRGHVASLGSRCDVESTAPAMWAGLEKLLALDHRLETEDGEQRQDSARRVLPKLFRSGEQSLSRKVVSLPMLLTGSARQG
jgi:hypothetical protein